MNPSDKAAAEKCIREYVLSGFYGADEIGTIVLDEMFAPGVIDPDWGRGRIASEFETKHQDERIWESPTDCERLDNAFVELRNNKIIALQNTGYESSDGIDAITEEWLSVGGEESDIVGYCFFHFQDIEGAIAHGGLMLAFGDILGAEDKGLIVGKTIVDVLNRHQFQVEWNGTIDKRIDIPAFKWRKRGPN